jgi:hypothetical protein
VTKGSLQILTCEERQKDPAFAGGVGIESDSRGARQASRQADHHTRLPRSSSVARLVWKREMGTENDISADDASVISYVEMCDRVGVSRFGDVWELSLTDDEFHDLEAGLWQASSAEAFRLAEEKAKAIEWRRKWVDNWLIENDLIDPVRRQHGLEIPPALSKRFEAAFFPVFGYTESNAELDLRGELELAYEDQSAKDWQSRDVPWDPPSGLTLQLLLAVLGDEPRPFLTGVIDLLAFGAPLPDKVLQLVGLLFEQKDRDVRTETLRALASEGYPYETVVSERRRATTAFFDGVRRAEQSVLIGSHDHHSDQPIPPHYFDVPRNLGSEDNSIRTDAYIVAMDARWQKQFDAEWQRKPTPWFNVRVDRKWLVGWLTSQLTISTGIDGLVQIPSSDGSFILQGVPSSAAQYPAVKTENAVEFSVSAAPTSPRKSSVGVFAKKRGKKPDKFERVMKDMRTDLANGALTADGLDQMLEKTLAGKYDASRDTCRRARKEVLAMHADLKAQDGSRT